MSYLSYNGKRIYYEVHGKGKPVLYLHGWTASIDSFRDNVTPWLGEKCRLILLDLPGYGRSELTDLSFESFNEIIRMLMKKQGLKRINVMGHCMGGAIGLDFALRNQECVDKLILVETYVEFPGILKPLLAMPFSEAVFRFFTRNAIGLFLTKKYLLMKKHRYQHSFVKRIMNINIPTSMLYLNLMWRYSKKDHYARAKSLTREVYLIYGKETKAFIRKLGEKLAQFLKARYYHFLDKTGHFPIEENPRQLSLVIDKILRS